MTALRRRCYLAARSLVVAALLAVAYLVVVTGGRVLG
jgi:hypothetical protein